MEPYASHGSVKSVLTNNPTILLYRRARRWAGEYLKATWPDAGLSKFEQRRLPKLRRRFAFALAE